MSTRVGGIIMIIMVIIMFYAVYYSRKRLHKNDKERLEETRKCKKSIKAKIVRVEEQLRDGFADIKDYKAIVSYTIDGKEYEVEDLSRPLYNIYKRKKEIVVLYDEDDYTKCFDKKGLKNEGISKGGQLYFAFHCSIFIIVGIIMIISNRPS